jgi:hypothetical protein
MHTPNNKTTQAIAVALASAFYDHDADITYGDRVIRTDALKQFLQVNELIGFDLAKWISERTRTIDMLIERLAELRKKQPKTLLAMAEQLLRALDDTENYQFWHRDEIREALINALKSGGYLYANGVLRSVQDDVVRAPATEALEELYTAIIGSRPADKQEDAFEALASGHRQQKLAVDNPDAQTWHSALGSFRTAVELVLAQCAMRVAAHRGEAFRQAHVARAVRDTLVDWDVFSQQEMNMFHSFYSFASEHGAHAAGSGAARDPERVQLARQLAPIVIQFVLSRVGKIVG